MPAKPWHLLALISVLFSSCTSAGPSSRTAPVEPAAGPASIGGTISYEARHSTKLGASRELEVRPARFVDLEVLDRAGQPLAQGSTDAEGRYELELGPGAAVLRVWAKVRNDEHDLAVTLDIGGQQTHYLDVPVAGETLDVVASDSADGGPAGAFHILDTILRGLEAAERWTGREMPPMFVFWGRGITTTWSYYRGEIPPGSGRYALELMGGDPGMQLTSDTDEHDEAIMLHELGHMVMDLVSTSSSIGGRHPPGVLVDPGLAWEEGRVSWFAVAVLGAPAYLDTVGIEPHGRLRVDRDYSVVNPGPQGEGSEQTVGEVLWDLVDGSAGLEDGDNDGVALEPAELMRAMMALNEVDGAYPALASFLRFLVDSGRVAEMELKTMLERTGQPDDLLPPVGSPTWPIELALPAEVSGEIDGLSNPAPSGGPAHPATGYDAVRAYRFRWERTGPIEVVLHIDGSGRPGERTDLDLEVRNIRGQMVGLSRGVSRTEQIRLIAPGPAWYVVYVRDGGRGNRARYRLSVGPLGSAM